jgi:formiminotetrahydrofolate cyclodeaminase
MTGVASHVGVSAGPLDSAAGSETGLATTRLIDLTLSDFAHQVGEPFPRAGGGSVAAFAGSMAAALVGMVCRLSIAKKGVEAGEAKLRSTCAAAETLRARLLAAVDADTDAYLQVAGAYRLPKDTAEESAARDAIMAAARRHAAEVPLAAAEACLEVLELAGGLGAGFNTAAASELAVAEQAALTCVRGGAVDVAINLKYLNEDSGVMEMRRRSAEIERRADEALAATWPILRDLSATCPSSRR